MGRQVQRQIRHGSLCKLRVVLKVGSCGRLLPIIAYDRDLKNCFRHSKQKIWLLNTLFFFAKVPMIVGHSISNVVEKIEKTICPRHIHQFSLLLGFASSLSFWVKGHSFLAESGYPSLRSMPGIGCHMGNPRLHPFADNCWYTRW